MKKAGKRTKDWERVRRNLKPKFERVGITTCELRYEGCWSDNGLGFAHTKKRANLGPGELSVVALLCNSCHDKIEILPEEEMTKVVLATIAARKQQPE